MEYELRPAEVTLEKPGTYAFVAENTGGEVHALEIEGQGIEKKTENIQPGQSTELKVNLKPGTYELYCPVANHKKLGMDGSIKVAVKGGTDGNTGDSEGGSGEVTEVFVRLDGVWAAPLRCYITNLNPDSRQRGFRNCRMIVLYDSGKVSGTRSLEVGNPQEEKARSPLERWG